MLWVTQTNHRDRSLRKLWWKANLHKHSSNNNTKDIDNRNINVIQRNPAFQEGNTTKSSLRFPEDNTCQVQMHETGEQFHPG